MTAGQAPSILCKKRVGFPFLHTEAADAAGTAKHESGVDVDEGKDIVRQDSHHQRVKKRRHLGWLVAGDLAVPKGDAFIFYGVDAVEEVFFFIRIRIFCDFFCFSVSTAFHPHYLLQLEFSERIYNNIAPVAGAQKRMLFCWAIERRLCCVDVNRRTWGWRLRW